jgi:tRNA pseudouridine55 synthase
MTVPFAFVNLRKSAGISSTQAGSAVRKQLQAYFQERGYRGKLPLGHFGTLDPLATGVLPLAIGKATKLFPLIADRSKRYSFTLVLGTSTVTGDEAGEPLASSPIPERAEERLQATLPAFHGAQQQIPPMVSALKQGGRRLYALARVGLVVERAARTVTIFALELLGVDPSPSPRSGLRFRVECSEGTYVRTLCEDLAAAIGTHGHMRALIREAAGPFRLDSARGFEEIVGDPGAALLDPLAMLPFSELRLEGEELRRFRQGQTIATQATGEEMLFVTACEAGERIVAGLASVQGDRLLPRAVFP